MAYLEAEVHKVIHMKDLVDVFLCSSQFLTGKLLDNGFEKKKVIHLPLFIPDDQFSDQKDDEGYLLFLGKLESLKGVYQIFSAAEKVPQVRIKLAGNIDEPLKSQITSIMPKNCEYLGLLSGDELMNVKKKARALTLPSVWYENQPFSILEMFALGKPVITSNIGGMKELVGANERGWLVEPNDVESLARCMSEAFEDTNQCTEKGHLAFDYAMKFHSETSHYHQLIEIYQELLHK